MNLLAMAIPDDPAELPDWLAQHLVGLDLAQLVAELSAVHAPPAGGAPWLAEVLGEWQEAVLREGLQALPPERLRQLLRWPRLLLELQELVLSEGGPYWNQVGRTSAALEEQVARGHRQLEAFLAAAARQRPATPAVLPLRGALAWYRRPWVVSLATAAAVLLAVLAYQRYDPPGRPSPQAVAGWGWSKPGALPEDVSADAYLNALADAAGEWFKKRPEDPVALAQRLGEFRQGCSVLLLAEHRPLAAADRQWLVERCRLWAGKLDQHRQAVEAGQDPLHVRAAADQTVNQLVDALRTRAGQLAPRPA
jgi:hypothetical protein